MNSLWRRSGPCINVLQRLGLAGSEEDLRVLKGLALGREMGRPHRRFTGAARPPVNPSQPANPSPQLYLLCTLLQTGMTILHREAEESRVLYGGYINNDVRPMTGDSAIPLGLLVHGLCAAALTETPRSLMTHVKDYPAHE